MIKLPHWLTEPYWRVRWYWWITVQSPTLPTTYNMVHKAKITQADYDIMAARWEKREPKRGAPPSVVRHRRRRNMTFPRYALITNPPDSTYKYAVYDAHRTKGNLYVYQSDDMDTCKEMRNACNAMEALYERNPGS